jgi:hypothetical protein
MSKVLLMAGLFCLGLGLLVSTDVIDSKAHLLLTVALPSGAILLGLFFISYIFEDETARFDAEQRARLSGVKAAPRTQAAPEDVGFGALSAPKRY